MPSFVKKSLRFSLRKAIYLANVVHEKFGGEFEGNFRRVVIFCPYSGVGNLLLWIPALRALHQAKPEVEVFLVGPSEDTALLLLDAGLVKGSLHFAPVANASFWEQAKFIVKNVRVLKPTVAVCTFLEPARRASMWALLSGARAARLWKKGRWDFIHQDITAISGGS